MQRPSLRKSLEELIPLANQDQIHAFTPVATVRATAITDPVMKANTNTPEGRKEKALAGKTCMLESN